MAKCANCGKTTTFGHNRSFSQRATNRTFKPNLQKTIVMEKGRMVHKILCAKCIKAMAKTAAAETQRSRTRISSTIASGAPAQIPLARASRTVTTTTVA